jgi:hypothetical protein
MGMWSLWDENSVHVAKRDVFDVCLEEVFEVVDGGVVLSSEVP